MSDGDVPEFQMSLRSLVTMTEEQRHLISKVTQDFPGTPRYLGKNGLQGATITKKRIAVVS